MSTCLKYKLSNNTQTNKNYSYINCENKTLSDTLSPGNNVMFCALKDSVSYDIGIQIMDMGMCTPVPVSDTNVISDITAPGTSGGATDEFKMRRPGYLKNKKCKNLNDAGKQKGFAPTQNIAGGLPTRNGKTFNHPLSVELGERASTILRDHNIVITDTNDWRSRDGKAHKNLDQQHGLAFSANYIDRGWNIERLKSTISKGIKLGLKFEFQIGDTDGGRVAVANIINQNPELKGYLVHSSIVTEPHFIVYFDC
jgi:hypothetical protein